MSEIIMSYEDIDYLDSLVSDQDPYLETNFILLPNADSPENYIPIVEQKPKRKIIDESLYELIEISGKPKSQQKIKDHYNNLQEYGNNITLGKALEKGAKYVRAYYNDKNLRNRKNEKN